jgi:hypothetical protein
MTSYINITVASFPTLTCVPIFDNNVLKHFYQKKFQRQGVGRGGGGGNSQIEKSAVRQLKENLLQIKCFCFVSEKYFFFFAKMSKFVAEKVEKLIKKLIVFKNLIFSHSTTIENINGTNTLS